MSKYIILFFKIFPYGDKGGENALLLQMMLKDEFRFERLDSSLVTFPFWKEYHVDTDIDMMWTWDFLEYQLPWNMGYTFESIQKAVHDPNPVQGGALLSSESENIILIHDMEDTDAFMPFYYEKLINYIMSCGVEFVEPSFIQ